MGMLGNTVYRFLCCVILCGILFSLFPDGKMKGLLRTCFGIFLTVALLSSFAGVELPDFAILRENYQQQAKEAALTGEAYTRQQFREFIKAHLEAYILDTASQYGCALTVSVEVDGDGYPVSAALWGEVTPAEQKKLETVISEELGIAKEDQHWNGSQTRKNSALP